MWLGICLLFAFFIFRSKLLRIKNPPTGVLFRKAGLLSGSLKLNDVDVVLCGNFLAVMTL
jgi:hypothetical protein